MTTEQKKSLEERIAALEAKTEAMPDLSNETFLQTLDSHLRVAVAEMVHNHIEKITDKQAESIVLRGLKSLGKEIVLLPFEIGKQFYLGCRDLMTKKAPKVQPTVEPAKA
jgi:hypothetical protein